MTDTQTKQILRHLQQGRTITSLEALKMYGCFRLSARISDLRDLGHDIRTNYVKSDKKRFAEYKLVSGV